MTGDRRDSTQACDDELVSAIFEISRARTMLIGVTAALPEPFQMYGSDIEQLLDRATARLRWLRVTAMQQPDSGSPPPGGYPRGT